MKLASQKLESSDEPIDFIARSCGFSSLSSFNKCFKQAFHTCPSAYRKHKQSESDTHFQWEIPLEEMHFYQLIKLCNKHQWLKQLLMQLVKNIGNDPVTIEAFASYLCTDSSNLNRKIKKLLGISTSKLIVDLRLQLACELLTIKKQSISDTAVLSGFYDNSHFLRQFKKVLGCTPGEFRKTAPVFPFHVRLSQEIAETKG